MRVMEYDDVLRSVLGWDACEKIDLLEGTPLADVGKKYGFWLWLVRGKIPARKVDELTVECRDMFTRFRNAKKVGHRIGAYESIQGTTYNCTCKYDYDGVLGHEVVHLPDPRCGVLTKMLDYTHDMLGVWNGDDMEFNEIVGNRYFVFDQNVPYHSDANDLLDANPTIMSISLGATGAFCYAPDYRTEFGKRWCQEPLTKREQKLKTIKERHTAAGVKGMVPLQAGDIMVMGGSFNRFFVHKTLRNCEVVGNHPTIESVLERYPAVRRRIQPSIDRFLQWLSKSSDKDVELAQRFCVTFRRIKYHKSIPRCPCIPGYVEAAIGVPMRAALPPSGDDGNESASEWQTWDDCDNGSTGGESPSRASTRAPGSSSWELDGEEVHGWSDWWGSYGKGASSPRHGWMPYRNNKRPRCERPCDQRSNAREKINACRTFIADNLHRYSPRSASLMCEKDLVDLDEQSKDSWLKEMEAWNQGARDFLIYLENQVLEWEGCRGGRLWGDAEVRGYRRFLRDSRARLCNAMVLQKLNEKAVLLLQKLRTFHNSIKTFDVVRTPGLRDKRWLNASNSGNRSKTYRCLLPLWYFLDVFNFADLEYFELHGGVRAHFMNLSKPWQELYILRVNEDGKQELRVLDWKAIGGGPFVEVRTIELALDYTSNMIRYQVLQPKFHGIAPEKRAEVLKEVLKEWMDLMLAVKSAQMQCTSSRVWPADSMGPWKAESLMWMPVVCWLRRQGDWRKR